MSTLANRKPCKAVTSDTVVQKNGVSFSNYSLRVKIVGYSSQGTNKDSTCVVKFNFTSTSKPQNNHFIEQRNSSSFF